MADFLMDELIAGQLHQSVVIAALSSNAPIVFKEVTVQVYEFIPHFLAHLREKLIQPFEKQAGNSTYYSPRQREELKKWNRSKTKERVQAKVNASGRSARLSLQYSSSSPIKKCTANDNSVEFSGISPIKNLAGGGEPKRMRPPYKIKPTTVLNTPTEKSATNNSFELNSFDDFPSMQSPPSTTTTKNPRRITATPVGGLAQRNKDATNRSNGTIGLLKGSDTRNTTSFLEQSSFETQNADPSFENLFQNNRRFGKNIVEHSSNNNNINNRDRTSANNTEFGIEYNGGRTSFHRNSIDTTPTKPPRDALDVNNIAEKKILNVLSEIYSSICSLNLVPNLTLEIYFLFTVLTSRISMHQQEVVDKFCYPFVNIECFVYFAVTCLEQLQRIVFLLDGKALQLLFENVRWQQFASACLLESLEKEITADASADVSFNLTSVRSPVTGIAFQTESDNRKSYLSDRHFHSFSKKRDAFYSLVRQWEENYSNPDWNLSNFLTKKVSELMKNVDGINNDYQFARLFVAQLLEMCRDSSHDKTDGLDTSDSVLLELKKRDPNRFQSLQDRLTKPSFSCDPCPKLSFSKVEEFFKEFIIVANSYCFNKCLTLVLVSGITNRDSKTFGLNQQINVRLDKSDFSESLWQDIKSTIVELRLLAKFLGFVLFLPFKSMSQEQCTEIRESRTLVTESLCLKSFLLNAFNNHRLLITVPWTVDFLSMADSNAFDIEVYKETLHCLTHIYRRMNTRLIQNCPNTLLMSLTLHIGWLFDQHSCQSFNFYQSICSLKRDKYGRSESPVKGRGGRSGSVGLDDIIVVDKQFLYMICPYLKVVKMPLSDFKRNADLNISGNFRKITPVRSTDVLSIDTRSNLKMQLLDGFLKYIPNHVKDCVQYLTDRYFMNMKHHISEVVLPACQEHYLERLKENFICDVGSEELNKDNLKVINKSLYQQNMVDGKHEARNKIEHYILSYLDEKIDLSIQSILPEDTNSKLLQVSSKVVRHNACNRIQEWLMANRELYSSGFDVLYNRHINHVIKAKKEHDCRRSFDALIL